MQLISRGLLIKKSLNLSISFTKSCTGYRYYSDSTTTSKPKDVSVNKILTFEEFKANREKIKEKQDLINKLHQANKSKDLDRVTETLSKIKSVENEIDIRLKPFQVQTAEQKQKELEQWKQFLDLKGVKSKEQLKNINKYEFERWKATGKTDAELDILRQEERQREQEEIDNIDKGQIEILNGQIPILSKFLSEQKDLDIGYQQRVLGIFTEKMIKSHILKETQSNSREILDGIMQSVESKTGIFANASQVDQQSLDDVMQNNSYYSKDELKNIFDVTLDDTRTQIITHNETSGFVIRYLPKSLVKDILKRNIIKGSLEVDDLVDSIDGLEMDRLQHQAISFDSVYVQADLADQVANEPNSEHILYIESYTNRNTPQRDSFDAVLDGKTGKLIVASTIEREGKKPIFSDPDNNFVKEYLSTEDDLKKEKDKKEKQIDEQRNLQLRKVLSNEQEEPKVPNELHLIKQEGLNILRREKLDLLIKKAQEMVESPELDSIQISKQIKPDAKNFVDESVLENQLNDSAVITNHLRNFLKYQLEKDKDAREAKSREEDELYINEMESFQQSLIASQGVPFSSAFGKPVGIYGEDVERSTDPNSFEFVANSAENYKPDLLYHPRTGKRFRVNKKHPKCILCQSPHWRVEPINIPLLKIYFNSLGDILPRYYTGNCSKHQRQITKAIRQAKALGLTDNKYGFRIFDPNILPLTPAEQTQVNKFETGDYTPEEEAAIFGEEIEMDDSEDGYVGVEKDKIQQEMGIEDDEADEVVE